MGRPFKEMNLMLHDAANFPHGVNDQNQKFEGKVARERGAIGDANYPVPDIARTVA